MPSSAEDSNFSDEELDFDYIIDFACLDKASSRVLH
jgi:hypothetical protein